MEGDGRALVVGAGYAGTKHADALRELGVPFTGPLSARRVMEDPRAFEDPAFTVVHVCSTNDLHVELAGRALRAGKDVVCEKPLAVDVGGAEELVALTRQTGRVAVLAYNYRFHPLVVELAARAVFLGPLHTARGSFLQDWLLLATDANWRVEEAHGGASRAIADIGAHWLDLVELVSGERVVAVAAQLGRLHDRGTEDHAGLLLRFSGGMTGTLVLSQAAAGHRNDMELSLDGSTGSLTWRHERPNELWLGSRAGDAVVVTRDEDGRTRTRVIIQKRSYLDPGTETFPGERVGNTGYIENPNQRAGSVIDNTSAGLLNTQSALPGPWTLPFKSNPWIGY